MGACLSASAAASDATKTSSGGGVAVTSDSSVSARFEKLLEGAIGKPQDDYDYLFKVLLLGASSVGKSSIMKRFCFNDFAYDVPSTIGLDYMHRFVTVDSHNVVQAERLNLEGAHHGPRAPSDKSARVKVQLWDTAGQERFAAVTRNYFKGVHCFVVVFDITQRDTFARVASFLEAIEQHGVAGAPILLVGNKSDLSSVRVVSELEAIEFSRAHPQIVGFMQTSASTGDGVTTAVHTLVTRFMKMMRDFQSKR
jgi:small GTP-binding protein